MVSASKAKEFAIPEDMSHIEVSAMSGRNINVAFYMLASGKQLANKADDFKTTTGHVVSRKARFIGDVELY